MLSHNNQRKHLDKVLLSFVAKSGNKKIGQIGASNTDRFTCPIRCPFRSTYKDGKIEQRNGCYAESMRTVKQWDSVSLSIDEFVRTVQENTEFGALIRHNVAGDICIPETSDINVFLLRKLQQAFKDRKAFTYTHADLNRRNRELIKDAVSSGFLINASCETVQEVKHALKHGINAVLAVTSINPEKRTWKQDGIVFSQCPAQYKDTNCKKCQLCAKDRLKSKTVICFESHGFANKRAAQAIEQKINLVGMRG